MGTTIKASGLDRNADAADRGLERGVGRLKKKIGWERVGGKGKETGPVSRKACPTNALHRGPKLPPIQ